MERMFQSEQELLSTLNEHDQLIYDCASERISFQDFLNEYDNFYMAYALDGHESKPEEQKLFGVYEDRIAPHREVWERVLVDGLCSDEDAQEESYIQAGRFGSDEGMRRLREISKKYLGRKGYLRGEETASTSGCN